MENVNLFDNSLTAIEYANHAEEKDWLLSIATDLKESCVNINNFNHSLVFQTVSTLHMNNAFNNFVTSNELKNFCSKKIHDCILPRDKKFSCTSMWATFIPPYGQLVPKEHDGVFFGSYFLHSPPDSTMMTFYSDVSDLYFAKFGNVLHNEYNHNIRTLSMPEGGIYFNPSYIKTGTTTNMSENTNVMINFVLDIVEK